MTRPIVILLVLFIQQATALVSRAAERPNIIVFYTDDHGYADLSCRGVLSDVKTPNIDTLARGGVLAKNGYSTAPQCVPSRAGLLTGRFQARFGLEANGGSLDGFNRETTIATRLQKVGYQTAQFGKWHLGPTDEIKKHGFKHFFSQHNQGKFSANISLDGQDRPISDLQPELYHVDGCSRAAASIIERYWDQPFFLYVAYRAPHTPLDAPKKYTDRFPGGMPERRRQALGMLSAVDDGVGLITETLTKHKLTEKTLIFLIGDNGAPLKIHKTDSPLDGDAGGWDGSLNTPLNGEKGMLAEGGMHTPFVVAWPGKIPGGQTYEHPISALDVAATAAAAVNLDVKPNELDGVNLIPFLSGENKAAPHDALYWRWISQSAIREGNWKLLRGGEREYLYDLGNDLEEKHNLVSEHTDIAVRLRNRLEAWSMELSPPGFTTGPMAPTWNNYYDFYLEGKPAALSVGKKTEPESAVNLQGWQARGGTLSAIDSTLEFVPEDGTKSKGGFITRTQIRVAGPCIAKLSLKSTTAGQAAIAWRMEGEKDFVPTNREPFPIQSSDEWQPYEVKVPSTGTVIHIRIHFPGGSTTLRRVELVPTTGSPVSLWK